MKQLAAQDEFWASHIDHYNLLSNVVHPGFLGPDFTDPMTRELLGFETLAYGHQYLVLGTVSAVRLSDQNPLPDRAQAAYARIHTTQEAELRRLVRSP